MLFWQALFSKLRASFTTIAIILITPRLLVSIEEADINMGTKGIMPKQDFYCSHDDIDSFTTDK
jgi:hypothetical protein